MNKQHKWFDVYPNNPKATNLSIAGGGVRLLSILLVVAAVPVTLALLATLVRIIMAGGGVSAALMFLVDELDEELTGAFLLWASVAVCRFAACVLSSKAGLLEAEQAPAPAVIPAEESGQEPS